MKPFRRFAVLLLSLLLLLGSAGADKGKTAEPEPPEVPLSVIEEVPETIQALLDLAFAEWQETDAKELKEVNKYTEWRGKGYKFGWCGGFVTWCLLQLEVPQEEHNKIQKGEVPGVVHVKEAGVGKLYTGYEKMNRITRVPQKGFIAILGNGKTFQGVGVTDYYHVGLVYDVEELGEGRYRITTIEGNVNSPGDDTHPKAAHTIRMYIRDYDMNAKKAQDLTLVPEEERTQEESALFSYGYTYNNQNLYLACFLMPWIPEAETPAP